MQPDTTTLLKKIGMNHPLIGFYDAPAAIAPFGSGCGTTISMFDDLGIPQAIIGATDIATRRFLPPELLAFTVTKPMFEQLCGLDEKSFLYKPFWQDLRKARGLTPT